VYGATRGQGLEEDGVRLDVHIELLIPKRILRAHRFAAVTPISQIRANLSRGLQDVP
jgi:hypothetical protein